MFQREEDWLSVVSCVILYDGCLSLTSYFSMESTLEEWSIYHTSEKYFSCQVLVTSEQPNKNKMAFVGILSKIKLLFGPLVIQLVWYILKQLFTSASVKVVDIYLHFGE